MSLQNTLRTEIESYNAVEPNVKIFIDRSSIFWVSEKNDFVWLSDHSGIADYIDEDHQLKEITTPEGVHSEGVFWMNEEFNSPFHISDFINQIETITV